MSCDKTSSALKSNLQINTSSLVRKIYEFEKRQGSSSTPVSFNVTPLSGSDHIPIFSYEESTFKDCYCFLPINKPNRRLCTKRTLV